MSLDSDIEAECRKLTIKAFGPDYTTKQLERVRDCAWAMFVFHAATGGDLDCSCGAHLCDEVTLDISLRTR